MKLTILATSDLHGYLYPTTYMHAKEDAPFGLFKAASAVEAERAHADGAFLLIENGDYIQGSPLTQFVKEEKGTPKSLIDALNELDYDVGIIGNHEFNYGLDYLKNALEQTNHPVLSANIRTTTGEYLADAPAKIIEKEGLKIGILGLTTQYIPHWEHPANIENLEFHSAVETAKEWVPKLKEQADLVIVAYHGGFESDLMTDDPTERHTGENEGHRILKEVPGIDVLITGHQHREIADVIDGVAIVQPGQRGERIGKIVLELERDDEEIKVVSKKTELLYTKDYPADPALVDKYQFLEDDIQSWLDEVIGKTNGDMKIYSAFDARLAEHPYVEFTNKVQLHYGQADISCTALFSDNVPGYDDEITVREVILNYPYPNTLSVIEINGAELKAALEKCAEYFILNEFNEIVVNPKYIQPKPQPYNYDMYEGIDYVLDISKPVGERVTKLEFQGKDVDPEDTFEFVTNQYRAVGGGNFEMFEGKEFLREVNISMSDLLIEFIKEHGTIDTSVNHNFQVVNGE